MTEYAVDPAHMALVNVDMQVAFVEGTPLSAPDGVALLPIVNRLAAACRAAGMMVIHTRHVTRPDGSNLGTMGELIEPVRDGYIMDGSETAKLHPGLDVKADDIFSRNRATAPSAAPTSTMCCARAASTPLS